MKIVCAHCGDESEKMPGAVNRALKASLRLFCDRACAGAGRRKFKPDAQKRAEKKAYDIEYRAARLSDIKARKAAYFRRTYDPAAAAKIRKARMLLHVQYCRRPEYKEKKREYDLHRRASEFGPFAEAYLLFLDINKEVNARISDYDCRILNGTLNKRLQRRRAYV